MKGVLKGFTWSAIDRIGFQLLQVITLVILSRLLQPEDFGLIAIVTFFTSIGNALIDSGFTAAIIQKASITNKDLNTAFIFNLAVAIVVYVFFFILAPFIAAYYHEPRVTATTRAICLMNLFSALGIVHLARLNRDINFKAVAKVNLAAALSSGILAVSLAFMGYGVWALVMQTLLFYSVQCILLWKTDRWRPQLQFDLFSFKQLFNYGYKLLSASLLEIAFQNIYTLIIGKRFSQFTLGIFSQSRRLTDVPANTASSIVQQVIFPAFSKIQHDNEEIRHRFAQSLRLLSFFIFPSMFFLAVVSKPIVYIFLTAKWGDAIPFLQVFFITNMLLCIHIANLNILKIKGRTDLYLRAEVYKKITGIVLIIGGLYFGIVGLMVSWVLNYVISYFINAWYCNNLIEFTLLEQIRAMLPSLSCTVIAGLLSYYLIQFMHNLWIQMLGGLGLCIVFYFLCAYIFRLKALQETILLVRPFLKNSKRIA